MFRTLLFILLFSVPIFGGPRIVIIGAGLSGLTAAHRLQEKGCDVRVYEARARVGGRVFSAYVNGHVAELGGQNIRDGGDAKHFLALVKEFGLETVEEKRVLHTSYVENDQILVLQTLIKERHYAPEKLREELESIARDADSLQEVMQTFFGESDPIYKILSVCIAGYEGTTIDRLSAYYVKTLYHFLIGGLSSLHLPQENFMFDHLCLKEGNGVLAEKMASQLYGLFLNHSLTSISKSDQGYELKFQNGVTTLADIIVLTIPCPVYSDIVIDETILPASRKHAIESLQYGSNAKIVTPVFAPEEQVGAYTNGEVITFLNCDHHIVNLYYTGDFGKFTSETIGARFQKDLKLLAVGYTVASAFLPICALDQQFGYYSRPVGHSWPNDPYAKGSYSCVGVGQEEQFLTTTVVNGIAVKTLFAPIEQSIFFAGEHTSILFDATGTMEAAVESGNRVVQQIFSFYE